MGETLIFLTAICLLIQQRKIMSALKNLQDAVTVLNTNADAVVVALANKGVAEADVQAQADAVTAANVKLQSALTPPPVV
jgi:hypothetical protein